MSGRHLAARLGSHWFVTGVLTFLLLYSAELRAEPSADRLSEQAKRHYERGQRAYERGEYEIAADQLRKAYALAAVPLLLYNISLAEWRAGDLEAATATALRASRAELPDRVGTRNRARLAAFRAITRSRSMTVGSGDGSADGDLGSRPRARAGAASRRSDALGTMGWLGVGLASGGVVSFGGSVWMDRRVGEAVERMELARSQGRASDANRILRNEVRPDQTVGRVLLVSGVGLTAAGAALVVVDLLNRESGAGASSDASRGEKRLRILPAAGRRAVGFQLHFGPTGAEESN